MDFGVNAAFEKSEGHAATKDEKTEVGEYGESVSDFDWRYGLKDYPHFELDARDYGYDSFQDAYNTNKKDYATKGGTKGIPVFEPDDQTQTVIVDGQEVTVHTRKATQEEVDAILNFIQTEQNKRNKMIINKRWNFTISNFE